MDMGWKNVFSFAINGKLHQHKKNRSKNECAKEIKTLRQNSMAKLK